MKRALLTGATAAMLALPAAASAKVVELGSTIPAGQVSCPTNCQALSRVTGYQSRAGVLRDPFLIPRAGKIVAFTVRLGDPTAEQMRFFQADLQLGQPSVQMSVLRRDTRRRTRNEHRLLAQSDPFPVKDHLGSAPTFVLDKPIQVSRRSIVALTTPTWAPALSVGLKRDHLWRASRPKGRCDNVSQRAQQVRLMSVKIFGCTYFTARLYYTVTYIPDNRPTAKTQS